MSVLSRVVVAGSVYKVICADTPEFTHVLPTRSQPKKRRKKRRKRNLSPLTAEEIAVHQLLTARVAPVELVTSGCAVESACNTEFRFGIGRIAHASYLVTS